MSVYNYAPIQIVGYPHPLIKYSINGIVHVKFHSIFLRGKACCRFFYIFTAT